MEIRGLRLSGWPLDLVLIFVNAVAAMNCRRLGGRRGIPCLPEVRAFLRTHGLADLFNAIS